MEENERRYTFIVAEPSLGLQKLIGYCLKPYGAIIPVFTATGLLKKLESSPVDILITEIDHWDMEMDELYAKLMEEYKDLPILLLTTRTIFEVGSLSPLRDSDVLVHKPFKKEVFIQAVEQVIAWYEQTRGGE